MANPPSSRALCETMRTQARRLRAQPSDAERVLWALLRDRQLARTKWRRKRPMGGHVVDFVCLEHRLVVECDDGRQGANARDAWLASLGFRRLCISPGDVLKARKKVIDTILAHCQAPI